MGRYLQVDTLFGSADGTKGTYAGGGGGATYWSKPVNLERHDGSPLGLYCVSDDGGAGGTLDLYTYSTPDSGEGTSPTAGEIVTRGYFAAISLTPTAGSETQYTGFALQTNKRLGKWARLRLVVPAGVTHLFFAQLEYRIED